MMKMVSTQDLSGHHGSHAEAFNHQSNGCLYGNVLQGPPGALREVMISD